jgi:formate/nitrite transporter FocA (FNT family)
MVMAAYIEGRATLQGLLKSWSVSYIGNLVGSLAVAKASHIPFLMYFKYMQLHRA